MNNPLKPYLYNTFYLIKENIYLLLIPIALTFSPSLFYLRPNNSFGTAISLMLRIGLIVMYPLIYGKFVAIIYGKNNISWGQLFALHWWNFILVSIVVNSPEIVLSFINDLIDVRMDLLILLISLLLNILSIYIFPIVFIENQRMSSIPLGIKCLLGNLKYSLPLIFISLSPIIFTLITKKYISASEISLSFIFLGLPQIIFTIFVDFTVFITATLILKAKLYQK